MSRLRIEDRGVGIEDRGVSRLRIEDRGVGIEDRGVGIEDRGVANKATEILSSTAFHIIVQSHSSASPHFIASAHSIIQTRSTPEESLAQPTMLLAFCAEGFAL